MKIPFQNYGIIYRKESGLKSAIKTWKVGRKAAGEAVKQLPQKDVSGFWSV